MRLRLVLTISFALLALTGIGQFAYSQRIAKEGQASVAIVELFTSEGCSSCPPADALLRQINLRHTGAGQLVVGISEHVTYWNYLGWKDPFSSSVFTDRQSAYASRLSPEGSYTPQMVLDGREQFVGSDTGALERGLRDEAARDHLELRILSFTPSSSRVEVKFSLSGAPTKPLDIVAVLTDDSVRSNVLRGENGGRFLEHASVARSLVRIASVRGDVEQSSEIALPEGFRQAGTSGHHLILLAQERGQGAILGAAVLQL